MPKVFDGKMFDVEHALNMYAYSYVVMPAFGIYEGEVLTQFKDNIRTCHVYLIGSVPKVECIDAKQDKNELVISFEVLRKQYDLRWPMPEGAELGGNPDSGWYVIDSIGTKSFPSNEMIMARLSNEKHVQDFEVLYIGQAFGEDGARNAVDRLKKHETLQKIAVKGIPSDHNLYLLLLEILPANRVITVFNPWAEKKDSEGERIDNGLDKLFNTSEAERTTLYEAALIRYFQPNFNKEFKNSFPSTNMKILSDCYAKDFSAIIAEISFDDLPFRLYSDKVPPQAYHIATHDLHTDNARQVFFKGPN